MSASRWVHIDVDEIRRETEKAFLIVIEDEEYWLPKSQIADADNYNQGDTDCTMSITEFIAGEKDLMP